MWLRGYPRAWLGPDVTAGLTSAAVVIPKAMAYATVAGLPLQVGLYTAFVPMVVYALLGTSRPLSVSTTTTIAILTAAALDEVAPGAQAQTLIAASATLAALVGVMLVLAALLRLGFVADFISEPVLVGFKAGIGVVIVVDQIPKLLGIHFHKEGFLRDALQIVQQLPQTSVATLLLACVLFVLIGTLEHFAPRLPAPLIGIAGAIAASSLLGLPSLGVETVGRVPSGLPHWIGPERDMLMTLWPAATGIALMSFTETIAAGRAFSVASEPRPQPNMELLALGLANFAGGTLGAMPAGGGTSQTAVNRNAGARTQMAELVTAAASVATLLLLAPVIAQLPQAALAAVVVAYSIGLIQPREFREIRRVRRVEFRWTVIAFVGVVLLGTLKGILIAIIASLVSLAHQATNPPVYALGRARGSNAFRPLDAKHQDDETWPGLLLVRIEGRVFFANAQRVGERILQLVDEARPSVVAIDCSALIDLEYTALAMLVQGERNLRERGITLWLVALNPLVDAVVRRSTLAEGLGPERIFPNRESAVRAYRALAAAATQHRNPA
jgi:high affinity sulfate transporter 1